MSEVAIIGAGVTGLSAAFRLKQLGISSTVYEAKERVGGVIQTTEKDGFLAEHGPNSALETSPAIRQLVHDLGLDGRRYYPSEAAKKRYVVRDGRPVPMPSSFGGFLNTSLFSRHAKWGLLKEPFIRKGDPQHEESVADFVRRRLGQEFLDYAVNPFVAGIYAGNPERLSLWHAFPKLYELEQRYGSLIRGQVLGARARKKRGTKSKQNAEQFSFDSGLQVLTDELLRRVEGNVYLGAPVRRVEQSGQEWRVLSGEGLNQEHSAVIFSAPAYQLGKIELEGEGDGDGDSGSGLSFLSDIDYAPVSSVVLGFKREQVRHPLDGFGMLIPERERFGILGTIFSSSLFPGRAPEGYVALTSYIGGRRWPEAAFKSRDELVELTCRDLSKILGLQGEPGFVHHALFPKAIPQYDIGYGRFREKMSEIENANPGVFFAGHYRDGISLSDSILSGLGIADRIDESLKSASGEALPLERGCDS